ncbi:class I SAM-dependent methyltransferase [Actinoallomurus rhizosphaericola]|uniref:class I SAM-dependent methyltransferase n=1 Tax=Actinoallomurus rhizosphaericola TaxID=2952536 RepID=UPI0020923A77|nr:class I SAM-dependent methyltransferase [Actinoallomurus rhizosphaericola]MCO6000223.1 methyltransferase domain-containing protein [Actinoallomurus rhizosphaericola]
MGRASARRRHPLFARVCPLMDRGLGPHRHALLDGLSGRVVEIGAGTGSNFAHYPHQIEAVLAVEPEPYLRRLSEAAAARTPVPIEVTDGSADRLPAADASCDAAVACLVLCTVPDPNAALAEILRVLRPGGRLRFLEHVQAESPARRRVQHALDAVLWPRLSGGCHLGRDTAATIERAGFVIERLDRLGPRETGIPFPVAPQILGTAVRPSRG